MNINAFEYLKLMNQSKSFKSEYIIGTENKTRELYRIKCVKYILVIIRNLLIHTFHYR